MEIIGIGHGKNHSKEITAKTLKSTPEDVKHGLMSALEHGSIDEYNAAILLRKYRDALLDHVSALHQDISQEIQEKSKKLAPKVYGWTNESVLDYKKYNSNDINDYQKTWEILKGLEAQEIPLEDEKVAIEFFEDLQDVLVGKDISKISSKARNAVPWLRPTSKRPILVKPLKKPKRKVKKRPEKSISQQKLEKELQEKELALQKELNTKFKASPIPASSLIPKYKQVMATQGTKTVLMRKEMLQKKLDEQKERRVYKIPRKPKVHVPIVPIEEKMKLDIHKRVSKSQENVKSAGLTPNHTFKPKITTHIPDFKKLQQDFFSSLESRKANHSPTVIQPFKGMMENEKRQVVEKLKVQTTTEPSKIAKPRIPIDTNPKIRNTHSFKLLLEHRQLKNEVQELIKQTQQEQEQQQLQQKKAIQEKIRCKINSTQSMIHKIEMEEKLEKSIKNRIQVEKEYKKKMQEMNERISNRRCLFENVGLANAKKKAVGNVNAVLAEAGLQIQDFE